MSTTIACTAGALWAMETCGDLRHLVVADRHPERGVLGQVQVLVRDRRHRDPERLRQHHVTEALEAREPDRVGRLALAARHGQDAAADDLGDVAGGVERRARSGARRTRATSRKPPLVESSPVSGVSSVHGRPVRTKPIARIEEQHAPRPEHAAMRLAGRLEAACPPDPHRGERAQPDQGEDPERQAARRPDRTTGPRCRGSRSTAARGARRPPGSAEGGSSRRGTRRG